MTPLCGDGFAGRRGRNIWSVAASFLMIVGLAAAALFVDWATLFIVIVGVTNPASCAP